MNSPAFFDDSHVENIKNLETYDFSMLATIPAAAHASRRNRVIIPDDDGHLREFIILETAQRDKKKKIKTVASYIELKKSKRISPVVLESQTVNMGLDWTLAGTGWQRGITEYAGIRKVTIDGYKDPYQMLKQLASLFELELRFRIVVDGSRIVGRYVDMIKRRGEDTKKETRLGKDLIGVERIENSDIVTALRVLGPELEDGSRLVVEVKNEEARQRWARDGEHLWEDYEPAISEDNVTVERLTELGEAQLLKRINTTVQYTAEAVSMEEIFGYTHEKVRLGDTNRIKDTSFAPPLYLEARVIEIHRSISAGKVKRKYVLGDFIEYAEEDLMKTFLQLQMLYGAKIIRSDTPPANPKQGMIWVDTSGERDVIYTWNAAIKDWDKATPTFADEVGAYDKETSDQKEQALHDELTHYTDIISEEKKQQAIGESKGYTNAELEAKRLALEASMDAIRNDLLAVEQQAAQDIVTLQNRADTILALAQVNEADLLAANGKIVTVEQNINTLEGSMVTTIDQLTSIDGIVSQQQTTIENHAGLISEKASQTTVNTLTGRVTTVEGSYQTLAGQVTLKANSADVYTKSQMNTELGKKVDTTIYNNKVSQLDVSISGISSRVSSTETSIEDLSGEMVLTKNDVASLDIKADGIISDVSSLIQTVTNQGNQITSANSNISQLSDQITQRVTKTEFDSLSIGGRNLALNSNVGWTSTSYNIIQGTLSQDWVVGETYTITIKGSINEGQRFRLWRDSGSSALSAFTYDSTKGLWFLTAVCPNTSQSVYDKFSVYNYPSSGATNATIEWIKIEKGNKATDWTPAPEDVLGQIDGHAGRIATAETTIQQQAGQIDLKASQTSVDTLTNRISTAETTLELIPGQLNAKVEKNGVVAAINLSPELTRIQSTRIHIDGGVTFSNGYNPTEKETPSGAQSKANSARDEAKNHTDYTTGNLVNNTTLSGTVSRWSGAGLSVASVDFQGESVPVQQTYTSGNSQVQSNSFAVDPAKAYEVTIWMRSNRSDGSNYFGLHAYGDDNAESNIGIDLVHDSTGNIDSYAQTNPYFWNSSGTSTLNQWVRFTAYIMPSGTSPSSMKGIGTNVNKNARMLPNTKRIRIRWLNYYNAAHRIVCVANPKVVEVDPNAIMHGSIAKNLTDTWKYSNTTYIDGGNIYTNTIKAIHINANEIEAYHIKSLNGLNINDQFVVASNGLVTMRGHLDGATGTFSGAVVGGSFERTSTSTGNRTIINENGIFVQYINSSATTVEQVSLQGNSVTWLNNTGSSVLATMRYSLNSLRINSSIVAIDGSLTTDQINTSDYLWVRRNSLNSAAYFTNQNSGRIAEFRSGAGDGSTRAYLENDGTLVTNRVRGLSSGNTVHIGTSGAVSFESKETEQHAFLKMGTVALKGLNGSSERLQIRNAADTSYSLLQLGTLQYQSMSQFSRRDYKKNISDVYINPISLLNELTFQDFHYKEQSDFDRKHLGLILDETNPYFHDATGDGLDTLRLLHVNTMAIQELDKHDNEQHLEIEALKKQVAGQQQRIIALENQIAS